MTGFKIGFHYFIMYVIRYSLEFLYVIILKNDGVIRAGKKKQFFANGSAASSTSAKIFNFERKKTNFFIFYINMFKERRSRLKEYWFLKKWRRFEKKLFFLVKKSWKMPCNSNNFQHIKNILRTYVDNLFLEIPLKFQVDRLKIKKLKTFKFTIYVQN